MYIEGSYVRVDKAAYAKTDAGPFNVLSANIIGFDSLENALLRVERGIKEHNSLNEAERTSVALLVLRFVADQSVYLPYTRRKIQLDI